MAQAAWRWYVDDRALIGMLATGKSLYIETTAKIPAGLHLFHDVIFFGALILADWLMVRHLIKFMRLYEF